MGVISQIWGAVKAGIILLLATRHAAKISSSGTFVSYFIGLLALLLFVWALEYEFLLSLPARFSQFESLRTVVMSIASLFILYFSYVLAAGINEWFEKNFMNGPYVLELVLVIAMVIFIFTVAGIRFARQASPRPTDVDHLSRISDLAVARYHRSLAAAPRVVRT